MATINSKIEGVDVLGVVTAGETIYVGRATSTQHGIVKPAATDFEFDAQTNAMLIKLGVGLKRTDDGIAIAIYDGNVVTDVLAVEDGLEIKYADIDEKTENSKVIPWSEFTTAEIEYLKKYFNIEPGTGEGAVQQIGAKATGPHSAAFGFETVANSDYETVVGKHNVSRTDALFQVGNGTDENNRKDAFVVYKDGRAEVDGAPTSEKGVIRLADLGYEVDFPYGGPTEVRCDNTDGITVTGTMRIYVNQSKTIYHDVTNVSVEIPIFAGKNVTIDADETNKKAIVKVSDMGSYGVDIGAGLPASATNGTLTAEQLALLQSSENNYIMFQHEKYYLEDKGHVEGYITYTHTGYESNTYWIKSITITVSTRAWVLNKGGLAGKGLDFDADGKLQVKAGTNLSFGEDGTLNASGGGGTIDVDTLNGLLSGGNGIVTAKNTAGDKVEVGMSRTSFELGNPGVTGKGINFKFDGSAENIYLSSPLGNTINIYNDTNSKDNYIQVRSDVEYTEILKDEITYHLPSQEVKYYLRENNVKTINGESIYGIGNIDTTPYMTDAYTVPTTVTSISELIPAGYNKYELEIFTDTTTKFSVFVDGHESYTNAVYLKLVQTGASMNALFCTETGNAIHTNNLGGQLKDRITIQGIDSGSPVVYICKKLN